MCPVKSIVRFGVISGLAIGGAVLVTEAVAPGRLHAISQQVQTQFVSALDEQIEDPVKLRNQLRDLEKQYPGKIAKVRGEIAELDEQLAQFHRDLDVAQRVVDLASADKQVLDAALAEAEQVRSEEPYATIRVKHNNSRLGVDDAYERASEIQRTINAYTARANAAQQSIDLLGQHRVRWTEQLDKLESEHAEFQARLAQLEGQIEMYARNEKLLDMLEERDRALRNFDTFEAVSLEQMNQQLAKKEAEQEARINALMQQSSGESYAEKAERQLQDEQNARAVYEQTMKLAPKPRGPVIEIGEDGKAEERTRSTRPDSVAQRTRVIDID
jgi:chromosome segregation ATPase